MLSIKRHTLKNNMLFNIIIILDTFIKIIKFFKIIRQKVKVRKKKLFKGPLRKSQSLSAQQMRSSARDHSVND